MQFHNRSIRLDRSAPWVTYAYIALCILIYLADTVTQWLGWGGANTGYLSLMGMRINALITMGQWWRLITPMFLHGSIMHLLMNCFALYVWGRYAETFYGKGRYALILLLSGFTGCVAGYAFSTYNALEPLVRFWVFWVRFLPSASRTGRYTMPFLAFRFLSTWRLI